MTPVDNQTAILDIVTDNKGRQKMVASKSCSFATGCFVCFAGGETRIVISAGRLVLLVP